MHLPLKGEIEYSWATSESGIEILNYLEAKGAKLKRENLM